MRVIAGVLKNSILVGCCVAAVLSINAQAEIYKCPSERGGVTYSDKPCSDGLVKQEDGWISALDHQKRQQEKEEAERQETQKKSEQLRAQQKIMAEAELERAVQSERQRQATIDIARSKGLFVVEYVVDGTASSASLTYNNASSGTEQQKVNLPWRKLMTVRRKYVAYISAQNQGEYGSVSVQILLNGILVKSSESSGEYGIASASGRI